MNDSRGAASRQRTYNDSVNPRRGYWWGGTATAAVLSAATWLRVPSAAPVVACAAATLLCVIAMWRTGRSWHRLGLLAAMLAFVGIASRAERDRSADAVLGSAATAARATVERRATARLVAALDREIGALRRIAAATLDAPSAPAAAFSYLDGLRGNEPTRALALVRTVAPGVAAPVAWSGRMMVPMDSLAGPVGVVGTPFYLAVYAIAGRGDDRAIAATLLHVERPADDIAAAMDTPVAADMGIDGFEFRDPNSSPADSFVVVRADGVPLLGVRAAAPPAAVLGARAVERGRTLGGLALFIALAFFLSATWGAGRDVRLRLGALGVALVVVATVPLSAFSNVSPLFDPAAFYVAAGGPFTGSIAALVLTSAIILAALLATIRSRAGRGSRRQAALAVLVVAGVGPFVLRDLARGIQFPQNGAPTALWIGWESAVFLASVTVLIAGVAVGRAALGPRRGLPLWIAVLTAMVASVTAPLLLRAPGAFPPWYPALWVLAIAALALGRRTRGAMLATAFVAACGAVTLVWGQSVRARVLLAERDVQALSRVDSAAAALLTRFTAQLDPATAPRSRVELLARYAASDLSAGNYPVELTSWDKHGRVIADLRVAMGNAVTAGLDFFSREARGARTPILHPAPGGAGVNVVLSVPHADSTVTTVVVAPRSRLLPRDPFGALVGVGAPSTTEPPYSLSLSETPQSFISSDERWTIIGSELHRDWYLPVTGGRIARVHAHVELRTFSALAARGTLLVIVDLALLGILWVLLVVADGAFGRWFRLTRRHWMRSYRGQLTVVLFAFFAIPAAAFVLFSYRRLASDDQQSRDLLVRETLRGVAAAAGDSTQLAELAARFDTPLFLFQNGVLVGASDAMLDVLAPTGRLLPEAAARALAEGDETAVSATVLVGTTPFRFGFRAGTDTTARLALGAPARTDDFALDRRRRDLGVYLLFAMAIGALAALWLSGRAARQFSRPIGELRRGALALAAGEHEPLLERNPPAEFEPVFSAFRRMARDLEAGRAQEAKAQRVLAWGEMARQVAHEIKNPLTPMRLGVQHLRRARHDPRVNFDEVLEQNVARLLKEIDRLDEIARAFSRYGTVPAESAAAEPMDVAQAVRDVVELEQLGAGSGEVAWTSAGADEPCLAMGRSTEFREVLLNLLENARLADARHVHVALEAHAGRAVTIRVRDDGSGMAADVRARIFEPHFSTRTSGSGLGLAISRRLIEGWGGTITVESEAGRGTTMRIALVPVAPS